MEERSLKYASRPGPQRRAAVLITGEETGSAFALVETFEERGTEPPRHLHRREDETLYVLEGDLAVRIDDAWIEVSAGAAVFLPRGVEHAYAVVTERARVLRFFTPAGIEDFYREMDDALAERDGASAEVERLVATAARYGCEITGPPLGGGHPYRGEVGVYSASAGTRSRTRGAEGASMPQMKVIKAEEFGGPEVLKTAGAERPSPGEGEVLVEVKSVGVNYADTMRRRNQYVLRQELPYFPGSEVAGVVAEVGPGVEGASEGDRVVTLLGTGGYAEYAVAPAGGLIPIPDDLGFDEAAAVPLQGLTAYHVIATSGMLKEGESVLVHAAAGGVGYLAVQMAKLLGAGKVIATASTGEKLDRAGALGADVLVNYTEEDWPERVREATDGKGADIILEMVGGDFLEKNLRCLNAFGRMVVFGAASGELGSVAPFKLMRKNQVVAGFFLPQLMGRSDLLGRSMQQILGWISSGDLKLDVGARYPLEEAAEAHRALEGRETTGKIVLNP